MSTARGAAAPIIRSFDTSQRLGLKKGLVLQGQVRLEYDIPRDLLFPFCVTSITEQGIHVILVDAGGRRKSRV